MQANRVPVHGLVSQDGSTNASPRAFISAHHNQEALLESVPEIPCTNLFSPLEHQDHMHDQGGPSSFLQNVNQFRPGASSTSPQEDLVPLVIGLKKEVGELKSLMAEILNTLSSIGLRRVSSHIVESEVAPSNARLLSSHGSVSNTSGSCHLKRNAYASGVPPVKPANVPCARESVKVPLGQHSRVELEWDSTTAYGHRTCSNNGNSIYMCKVPPLPPNSREDKSSLINKASRWLRHNRHCGSIIYSEILSADRFSSNQGCWDVIRLKLASPHLVKGLLSMEARNTMWKETKNFLSGSWPPNSPLGTILHPSLKPATPNEGPGLTAFCEELSRVAPTEEYDPSSERSILCETDHLAVTSDID
ncbi:hypothetical protein NDU88_003461 [Pleurodeles waltl]|uniref:Uncharacterized protein n=1 Tax=Pleurodeles waltl TaxID=8319 RepID=A0AAV7MQS9_PLEWA|nr:hypothetical protein NDU88_003461 [Pleurodeles waltl]